MPSMERAAAPRGLHTPPPLPLAELDELVETLTRLRPGIGLAAIIRDERAGRTAAELAAEAIKDGSLTEDEAHKLLAHAAAVGQMADKSGLRGGAPAAAALARDSLRVAVRLAPRLRERRGGWIRDLVSAVLGADTHQLAPPEDEGEFDSLAAVVAFTLADDYLRFTETSFALWGPHRTITLRALDALLRERPHELDRITSCLDGHDEDTIIALDDEDIALLREHLEATEDAPAVAAGWI